MLLQKETQPLTANVAPGVFATACKEICERPHTSQACNDNMKYNQWDQ